MSTSVSLRLARTVTRMRAKSIKPQATMNSNAAMVARGMYAASGETNSRMSSRKPAENIAASGVRAPASKFAPLRLNDPDVGYEDVNVPTMLANP